ncbi:hypothetical protein JZ751_011503 [Albula glossodonta]|uniref:Uncharacterized protein n=1 Tax=Albula glossodonta TaxID=121402 RepID=A0A8T2N014_9TELE|nr:hypothetical protein JZ751_011503 [Albula glossodonta]
MPWVPALLFRWKGVNVLVRLKYICALSITSIITSLKYNHERKLQQHKTAQLKREEKKCCNADLTEIRPSERKQGMSGLARGRASPNAGPNRASRPRIHPPHQAFLRAEGVGPTCRIWGSISEMQVTQEGPVWLPAESPAGAPHRSRSFPLEGRTSRKSSGGSSCICASVVAAQFQQRVATLSPLL